MIVDFHGADDAAVVRLDGNDAIVQTVDFFTPIVDDPYAFGQIAAANSLSDVYAMGGEPLFALNIVAFPSGDLPNEVLLQILKGGSDKAREAGISVVGGHSIDDKEPKYGLVVTGRVTLDGIVKNSTAQPGDVLVLTKPLGTGIIATAVKRGVADQSVIQQATEVMTQLNRLAAELMVKYDAHAATDVTGYGLLGHLFEMCEASSVSAVIEFNQLPFLDSVETLAQEGIIPGGTKRNLDFVSQRTAFSPDLADHQKLMATDAQTSGGLLISFSEQSANNFLSDFDEQSPTPAFQIGTVNDKGDHLISVE